MFFAAIKANTAATIKTQKDVRRLLMRCFFLVFVDLPLVVLLAFWFLVGFIDLFTMFLLYHNTCA